MKLVTQVHTPRRKLGILPTRTAYSGAMTVNSANETKKIMATLLIGNFHLKFELND